MSKPSALIEDLRYGSLKARAVSERTCRHFGYALARHRGETVHVAPYHDASGALVAQKIRRPDKTFEVLGDVGEAVLFGQHLWPSRGKMVVVTEGEIDALSVSQIQDNRWPVVSLPAGASSAVKAVKRSLEWLTGFERVVLAFDMDEPGRKAAVQVAELLPPGKAYIASLPRKDANEALVAGEGPAIKSALWNAAPWRPDGILSGAEAWERARATEDVPARPFGYPMLDDRCGGGYRPGELVVVTGGTGSGKTTLVQQLVADALEDGVRVGLLSLESPLRRVVLDLCSTLRRAPRQEDFTDENHEAWSAVADRLALYQHFGSTEVDNIVSRMRYMARAEDCDVLVLDHLSIVVSGADVDSDERRTIDRLMTLLATLAQETETTVVVISHLKRIQEGTHEEGARITLGHLRGSGSIAQLGHTIVAVERDQQGTDRKATLRLLKCRHTGRVGVADTVFFQPDQQRLVTDTAAGYGLD